MSLRTRLERFVTKYREIADGTTPSTQQTTQVSPLSIVYDVSNGTVIAITNSVPSANIIIETMLDTGYFHGIISSEAHALLAQDPHTYPEYVWDPFKRVFKKTHPDLVTEELRERARFAKKKMDAISFAIAATNNIRQRLRTGVWYQERIYELKEEQARRFKNSGFDEKLLESIPYVRQEAEDRNVSLVEATEDIILHADLFNEFLLRSEQSRLSLFRAIKRAKTDAEVDSAIAKFRLDGIL